MDDKFSGPLGRAQSSLRGLEKSGVQLGRGLGQIGSGLATLGTRAALVAAGGLTAVVTTAASFEQAFTGVEKTVDGTDAQLGELEQTLRQMARTIPVSFEELAGIAAEGGALGIARDSLDEFTDVVARLSVSTNLTSEEAATALGQLGTVLHLTGDDFEEFADTLVGLGNAGASTEDQIIALAARFAAAGNSAGLSKEEILALSSATASMGIEVEAGGTALSQTFNGITKAIGTGSDEIKAYTKTLGISAAEFKQRWTEDAIGTFRDFLGELSKLDKYQQADILEQAGITGIRQLNAIQLMTQNLGFFDDQLKVANESQGALDKESQKFFDTTAGQWKVLTQNVRDAAATIGAELLPVVNSLIKDFVGKLQEPGSQAALKSFGADLAAGVKGLVTELKGTDFSGIIGGMKLAAEVAKGAFNAFRALPAPIQQLAIAALVANKVSGGAIGQIAKGLFNVGAGAGGLVGGLFGGRGTSAANPVWVQQAGVGGAGGGGVGGASLLTKVFLSGIAIEAGFLLGKAITDGLVEAGVAGIKPAKEYEQSALTSAVNSNDVGRIVAGIDSIDEQLKPSLTDVGLSLEESGAAIALALDLGGVRTQLEQDRQVLLDQLTEMGLTREQAEKIVEAQKATTLKYGETATRQIAAVNALKLPLGLGNVITQQIRDRAIATAEQTRQTALNTANAARLTGSLLEPVRNTAYQSANAARLTGSLLNPLERIAAKKTSFTANIYNSVQAYLSVTQAVYAQTLYKQIQYDDLGVGLN